MKFTIKEEFGFIIVVDENGNEINYAPKMEFILHAVYNGKGYEKNGQCYWKGVGRGTKVTKEFEEWIEKLDKLAYEEFYK